MRYNDDWKEFWWTKITGAHTVVNRVAMTLLENKTVILKVPSDLPWRDAMRSSVHDLFSECCNNDVVIEFIDLLDDDPDDSEPGRLILEKFADSSVKNGYREKSQLTIQKYIISKRVIANRIIWVKGFTEKTAAKWIKFCKNFSPLRRRTGCWIMWLIHNEYKKDICPQRLTTNRFAGIFFYYSNLSCLSLYYLK